MFPTCYASKNLSDAELNYSTTGKECLAVVWGIKRFHMHLYGVRFVLQTDHEPLKYMNSAKFTNNRLMRWAIFLQSYNMEVQAIKGSDQTTSEHVTLVLCWSKHIARRSVYFIHINKFSLLCRNFANVLSSVFYQFFFQVFNAAAKRLNSPARFSRTTGRSAEKAS